MKKLTFITIALITVMFSACKKTETQDTKPSVDYTKPENLSGTTWKSFSISVDPTMEWAGLIFKSSTEVEGWSKYKNANEAKDWTGTFTIVNTAITFNYLMDSIPQSFAGTISGESITCPMGTTSIVFRKQ